VWVRACVGVLCFGMVGELEGDMFSVIISIAFPVVYSAIYGH